jgi:hypothetical protein
MPSSYWAHFKHWQKNFSYLQRAPPYPTEFLLDQGQAVLKRGMPTLAGIFALFNFSL